MPNENNSSAPLKTAEEVYPALPAGLYASAFHSESIVFTAEQMRAYAAQAVAAQAPAAVVYAEARECSHCNHVGINDSADGVAACISCAWHGDSPKDDKCPECEAEGTMTASCPKCHHEYRLLADASIATPALPATGYSSAGDLAELAAQPASWSYQKIESRIQTLMAETAYPESHSVARAMKQLVNELHAEYGTSPQAEAQAEPVMIYHGHCTIDCGEHGHHDMEMLKMIPAGAALYTAPQAQPADALDASRFAWLAKSGWYVGPDSFYADEAGGLQNYDDMNLSPEELRASVDAAMAAAQEGGNAAKEA